MPYQAHSTAQDSGSRPGGKFKRMPDLLLISWWDQCDQCGLGVHQLPSFSGSFSILARSLSLIEEPYKPSPRSIPWLHHALYATRPLRNQSVIYLIATPWWTNADIRIIEITLRPDGWSLELAVITVITRSPLKISAFLYISTRFFNPSPELSPSSTSMSTQSFDYVICGGGLAGLVLANRLSEDPLVNVAVIEAGGDVAHWPDSQIPGTCVYART